jgi:hypothetical protein
VGQCQTRAKPYYGGSTAAAAAAPSPGSGTAGKRLLCAVKARRSTAGPSTAQHPDLAATADKFSSVLLHVTDVPMAAAHSVCIIHAHSLTISLCCCPHARVCRSSSPARAPWSSKQLQQQQLEVSPLLVLLLFWSVSQRLSSSYVLRGEAWVSTCSCQKQCAACC